MAHDYKNWTHVLASWDSSERSELCVADGGKITVYDKDGNIKKVLTDVQHKADKL